MKTFLDRAIMQNHPLRVLETFLEQEWANEQAQKYEAMRFVGYVLDIGYETITIITSDPFKIAVGGIPTGKYVANPTYADVIGADTIFATLPNILSNRYEGALLPIELAHIVASLSTYPSAPILKMFAERARKGQLDSVE
jgi:hypothetical protein